MGQISNPPLENLTPREREILGMIGEGLSIPEIAERLYRSQKTVETHRLALGRKLGANNRVELARIAIRHGLAPLELPHDQRRVPDPRDHLSQQSPAWQALRHIEAAVASSAGPTYFRRLLSSLADHLQARAAMIAEIVDLDAPRSGRSGLRVQANLGGGQMADPQTVPLEGSVLEPLTEHRTIRIEEDLATRYPKCSLAKRINARYFLGTRLHNAAGDPIGMLGLMHDHPLPPSLETEHILKICASRAAVELERFRMEEQLREASETLEGKVRERTVELENAYNQLRDRIEKQRLSEARLHDSQQQYLTLVETMNEGLATLDPDGNLMFVNQQFAKMCGRTKEQLIGHHSTEFLPSDEAKRFGELYKQRLASELDQYRLRVNRPDASQVTMEITTRSLFNDQGDYIGSLGVVRKVD